MSTYITFQGGNGGAGGGGGGPASPALGGSGTNAGSSQDSHQGNLGSETTDPKQSMLVIHREHLNINVQPTRGLGYVTTVPTIRMPRRLVLTANGYHLNRGHFAFIVDVLLVPLIFDVRTCFDLYLEPFGPGSPSWFMGSRRLRDNVLLLRRLAVQGTFLICAVEQCDIPEEIRNRADYRLVLTIPVCHLAAGSGAQGTSAQEERGLFLQLEMEF
ncbi:hypothetical protein BC827DRAFT_1385162 [Russula dissimulans]|nr:hypothetical protein BC827DRAFT_1385162 [Russula dissimulans]